MHVVRPERCEVCVASKEGASFVGAAIFVGMRAGLGETIHLCEVCQMMTMKEFQRLHAKTKVPS